MTEGHCIMQLEVRGRFKFPLGPGQRKLLGDPALYTFLHVHFSRVLHNKHSENS